MNAFESNNHFLTVSIDGQRNRTRSERASSLALPLNSLLDFYDKQQEQCKSATLLPTSVSSIVRRHSSHCYPMLEDNNKQKPQTLHIEQPLDLLVNMAEQKYCKSSSMGVGKVAAMVRVDTPVTPPPPPIPRRVLRAKNAWNGSDSNELIMQQPSTVSTMRIPLQQQLQQQQQQQYRQEQEPLGTVFVYPQPMRPSTIASAVSQSGLLVDITARSTYTDNDGISDDDRMSLENSVFDESLTSTPVKVANYTGSGGVVGGGSRFNNHVRAMAGLTTTNTSTTCTTTSESNHVAKRANRSSSSTVDSATISSGYGSSGHSERFASSSTSVDFRSRFSSVDTQSSLDSILVEKSSDSPLAKDTFKLERATFNEAANKLNNNEIRNHCAITSNNNNGYSSTTRPLLPVVPARRPTTGAILKQSPTSNNSSSSNRSSSDSRDKDTVSVSASASTSSAASAGSSTISSTTMSSISMSGGGGGGVGTSTNANNPKRPVPPPPPLRAHNSIENTEGVKPLLTVRNKLNRNRPPPIVYPKLQQRQDSTLSSDNYSITSSPGYNTKNYMNTPLLQSSSSTLTSSSSRKAGAPGKAYRQSHDVTPVKDMAMTRFTNPIGPSSSSASQRGKIDFRQDSTISNDSFSQTSSPGYNTKLMEAPLLPTLSAKRLCGTPAPIVCRQGINSEPIHELEPPPQTLAQLNKCASPPTSLQTIVRFQNGASHTVSLQHQIINRRKSSNPYITNGRLKFRLFQILINAFALLAIAGGLAAYFNAYPTIKFVNKTIINTIHVEDTSSFGKNPAPGTCLPIIVKFCQSPLIPYNYTVFPNYIGHFGQLETQVDLDSYEALVDVRCYELVSLFLCTLFVPKCGSNGGSVPPCKTLCTETMRRCGFFFDVFGLSLPEYLNCKLFKDFSSSEECVGLDEVRDVMIAAANPKCEGFQCDQNRCLPKEYVCDGYIDCMDQEDEAKCERCEPNEIYCGDDQCIGTKHICDGIIDCPYGQDERNCLRLSERNGDVGTGVLEVFRMSMRQWTPACVKNWDRAVSPSAVCSILGYSAVNATSVVTQRTHRPLLASVNVSTDIWKMYAKKRSTLMQEFANCKQSEDYPIAELTCSNYECGKVKRGRHKPSRRIIGGSQAKPGNWPFLAAILGGPEKIFYCAGVLISDQWVLTASHCVGNHTVIDLEDWTIQLGVTRRNSFTYTGQKVKVKAVIPHPQYNMAIAHDNDIALFQLASRVAFHEHLLPVCLPPPSVKYLRPDLLCTVIGWGKREEKNPKSTYEFIVNEVQVPIIGRSQCDEWLDNLTVSEGMVCGGYDDGGKDACQGDSGGPLLCPYPGEKDRWFVGGIVSWGIMCAHPRLPGVYANVVKYVPWIQEQIQKYSRPLSEERVNKYDLHPGGPDILSKMATGPIRSRKPYLYHNGKPMGIDYYDSDEKK